MNAADQPETTTETPAPKKRAGPIGFFVRVAAVIVAAALTIVAFAVLTPDGNDYAQASKLKHEALRRSENKVVLIGGSNLAYGIDSTIIENTTHCPVVNMGMNGFLGIRFMLEEVKPYVRRGDVVVIAFEHESYARPVDGAANDLLMITKANPTTLSALTPSQLLRVASRYPYVAHQKLLRILGDQTRVIGHALGFAELENLDDLPPWDMRRVERLSGFNANGDLTTHLGVRQPGGTLEIEEDLPPFELEPEVVPLFKSFVEEMSRQGVRVLISYSSVERSFYEQHRQAIDGWDAIFRANEFTVPSPPSNYVFDPSMHFDTVYHLNEVGRAIRSQTLANDIVGVFEGAPPCSPAAPAQESVPQ